MHYYEHHIGDYAAATAHLSLVEDAIYCRMLRRYYLTESPLPVEVEAIARVIGARDEVEIVKTVLFEFFTLADDGWHQKRADEDIARVRVKAEKARASANARWEGGIVKPACERIANASETHNERNAPKLQAPNTNNQIEAKEAKASSSPDADALVDAYHEKLPRCQRAEVLNDKRRKRIAIAVKLAKTVCRDQGWPWDAEKFWGAYFDECATDPWMRGDVPHPTRPTWKQNLDVLLAEDRFAAVMDRAIAAMRGAA